MNQPRGIFALGLVLWAVVLIEPGLAAEKAQPAQQKNSTAVKIDAAAEYPIVVGTAAQNFNSTIGGGGTVSVMGLFAPWMSNYASVSYSSFTLRSDSVSSFRLVPVTVGFGLPGKVTDGLTTEVDFGLGGAFGYINSPGATSYRAYGYFLLQTRAMIDYELGAGFGIFARLPVNFILGTNKLTYLAYSAGLSFKL